MGIKNKAHLSIDIFDIITKKVAKRKFAYVVQTLLLGNHIHIN